MQFNFSGIASFHHQLQQGTITCADAVRYYLSQIKANTHLNAMVSIFADEAMEHARQLDESMQDGMELRPLHGVILAVKDVLCIKGKTVSAASKMLKGFESLYTATAVQRLIDAGAIIIGTCNCDEFAMGSTNENSALGAVKNAADETRVPGGSSGGSAVAVQAGLCMVSLGSDTGGSVRQPADFCGVVGLKPTYGRVSRYGLIAYASSFDCIGVFGQSVPDVAVVYEIMAGYDAKDSTSSHNQVEPCFPAIKAAGRQYRFAYFDSTLNLPGLDPEIKVALLNLFEQLRNLGHTVEAIPFNLLEYVVPTYYVLTTAESSSNLSRYDGVRYGHRTSVATDDLTEFYKLNRSEGFGAEVKRRIMLGSFVLSAGFYDAYFTKAQQVRRMLTTQTASVFEDYDAILMPVSPTTAFKLGEKNTDPVAMYLADIYTVFANLTGVPAMSIPRFRHSNGMPFGLQVLTNRWKEVLLHQLSHYINDLDNGMQEQ